jgi:hypothetical protein
MRSFRDFLKKDSKESFIIFSVVLSLDSLVFKVVPNSDKVMSAIMAAMMSFDFCIIIEFG